MSTATHNPDCVSALEGVSRTSAPIRSEMALTMERPKPEPSLIATQAAIKWIENAVVLSLWNARPRVFDCKDYRVTGG